MTTRLSRFGIELRGRCEDAPANSERGPHGRNLRDIVNKRGRHRLTLCLFAAGCS